MTTLVNEEKVAAIFEDLYRIYGEDKIKELKVASDRWIERFGNERSGDDWAEAMILEGTSYIDEAAPYWTFATARVYLYQIYAEQERRRGREVYTGFAEHVQTLVDEGLYTAALTEKYTKEELEEAGSFIDPSR